jgi:hypothetical protein
MALAWRGLASVLLLACIKDCKRLVAGFASCSGRMFMDPNRKTPTISGGGILDLPAERHAGQLFTRRKDAPLPE